MSENFPEPDLPESDQELETLLKNLEPNPLDFALLRSLEENFEHTSAKQPRLEPEAGLKWDRLIPLALVGALGMLAYASFRFGPHLNSPSEPVVAESAHVQAPGIVSSFEAGQFQPVSAQGFLMNSSSAGLVETETGPQERMNLEYRDAYHWLDPETGTSIRYFQPRSEELIIPLQTD